MRREFFTHFFDFLTTYLNTTNMNNLSIYILSKNILRHYNTLKINSICVCSRINRRKSMFSSTQIIRYTGNRKWNKKWNVQNLSQLSKFSKIFISALKFLLKFPDQANYTFNINLGRGPRLPHHTAFVTHTTVVNRSYFV